MIISTSHTLEYKPNDIIITSSKISLRLYVISFPGSSSKDLGGGASVLILTLALLRRRTECRLDFQHVTVSRGHIMAPAGPSVRSNARLGLSVALRDRPESREGRSIWKSTWPLRPATSRYRTRSCGATPENQRMPDSASLPSFPEQRYLARCVAPRDLGLLNRVATVS